MIKLMSRKKRLKFSTTEINIMTDLYINGKDIKYISEKLNRSKDVISKKIKSLELSTRLPSENQREFEDMLFEQISEYWENKGGHTPELYQNQFGEVRSKMKNGIPEYLTTTKYLKKS